MDWFADSIRFSLSPGPASRGSVNEPINIDAGAGICQSGCRSTPGALPCQQPRGRGCPASKESSQVDSCWDASGTCPAFTGTLGSVSINLNYPAKDF